ncbi:MAG TPA: ABC transporter ATP-binding protein [Candidatus Saccharimonadales bacterium]|nr:ABC transporter ATP-binding protein [Candidatus Saccharimonadales bacterium]
MDPSRKTILLFWRENMRHPLFFIGAGASWVLGMSLQRLVLTIIASRALNHLIAIHNQPHINYWHEFSPYLGIFIGVAVVAQILIECGLVFLTHLETRVRPELQMRAFTWLTSQSLNFHANTFSGAIVNQVNKFTGAYITLTDTFCLRFLRMFTNVIIAMVVVAFFSPVIALAMAIWTVCFVFLNYKLFIRRMVFTKAAATAETVLTAHLADAMGNISAVKAFGNEDTEAHIHKQKSDDRAHKKYLSWMAGIRTDTILGTMMTILQIVVLGLTLRAVSSHVIEIGTMLLIQVYVMQMISELWDLSNMTRTVEQSVADAEEMVEVFDVEPEVKDPAKPEKVRITQGAITVDNVTFTHDGANGALFTGFSLNIKPGEKIGLVGHSGSGKTTLTRLLLRFSDLDSGVITIDGQNISSIKQAELRSHIAYVPQEPVLFHRSLRENIAYARPSASKADVVRAAKLAHADGFIGTLPDGYDTLVGERGVKLSGGQRQRIAIARAILKDAPILLLDEATSALDSESEHLIQSALTKLMQGRTTIVIAHRLSTIQKMDRIVVMEDGQIVEQGSHTELLKQKGTYAQLWAHQSGGFIEE